MHVHLDRVTAPLSAAAGLAARGVAAFCNTVDPAGYVAARELFSVYPLVRVGVGLHPWWIDEAVRAGGPTAARALAEEAARLAGRERFVGEVGLDFAGARVETAAEQVAALEMIFRACAERAVSGRVVSVHAVRSVGEALDALDWTGCAGGSNCIFHWFSGTSAELARAREMGCYFSVGARMLATRRGREYARQVPLDRLLLETDAPARAGDAVTGEELADELLGTAGRIVELRRGRGGAGAAEDADELARLVTETSARLLGL